MILRRFASVLCFVFCILYAPVDPDGEVVAGGAYDLGYPVERTPFDFKLASANFFNENFAAAFHASSSQTVEQLFRTARSFRYATAELHGNQWQSVKETSLRHSGNCIDKALWLYAQLKKNGYRRVRLVIGKYRPIDSVFHAWVIYVNESGDDYLLDASVQNRPWKLREFSERWYQPLYSFDGRNRYLEFNQPRQVSAVGSIV